MNIPTLSNLNVAMETVELLLFAVDEGVGTLVLLESELTDEVRIFSSKSPVYKNFTNRSSISGSSSSRRNSSCA